MIAAGTHILSPRAARGRPYQRWPQLQNPEWPSPHRSLTLCSASWCMVIQNLTYKSQINNWIIKKTNLKHFTKCNSFILCLGVACSPWNRDIFDFFDVQINYLQVPCRHWRCHVWKSNQRSNQQNKHKVTSDMLSVPLCKALTFGVDIFKRYFAWWESPDNLIGWKQTSAVPASG